MDVTNAVDWSRQALWTALIPIISRPILSLAQTGFAQLSVGLVLGSLISVIVLFAVPVILLGMVSPFVIRLRIRELETAQLMPTLRDLSEWSIDGRHELADLQVRRPGLEDVYLALTEGRP